MIINFCDPRLFPKISCDKVNHDGYPVENLVSSDFRKRQMGFIAEYFIKPPVTVTLTFPVNIEIYKIYINPVIGSQKSSSFEIYTLSQRIFNSWITDNFDTDITLPDTKHSGKIFQFLGKGYLDNPDVVCFHNKSFISHNSDAIPKLISAKYHFDLRTHKANTVNFVSHLNIRILKAAAGKAIAIRSIAVWGRPARLATTLQVQTIYKLLQPSSKMEQTLPTEKQELNASINDTHETDTGSQLELEQNQLEIPEEFLDPLTCEMMNMPVLLPCGKSIDQLTLDKHIDSEASRGRFPSDPFTGVMFDDKKRPVPNVFLKTRIDKFVLSNTGLLENIPRPVGRATIHASQSDPPSCSRLLREIESAEEHLHIIGNSHSGENNDLSRKNFSNGLIRKRKGEELTDQPCFMFDRSFQKSALDIQCDTNHRGQCKRQKSLLSASSSDESMKHEDKLQHSLDSALQSALGSLPSFINRPKSSETLQMNKNDGCINCKSSDSLYQAPCKHLFCRKCLTSCVSSSSGYSLIKDILCNKKWQKSEFIKVHN